MNNERLFAAFERYAVARRPTVERRLCVGVIKNAKRFVTDVLLRTNVDWRIVGVFRFKPVGGVNAAQHAYVNQTRRQRQ